MEEQTVDWADDPAGERTDGEERYVCISRLTIGDGFRFGCGLTLALAAFCFALVILVTSFALAVFVLNLDLPLDLGFVG